MHHAGTVFAGHLQKSAMMHFFAKQPAGRTAAMAVQDQPMVLVASVRLGHGEFGKLIDRGTAAHKIRHHLFRDDLRVGRDASRHHAMVAGKNGDGRMPQGGNFTSLPVRHPCGQLFKSTKTSRRFGELGLPLNRGFSRARVAPWQIPTESADLI